MRFFKTTIKAIFIIFAVITSVIPSITQAQTLVDSPPITATSDDQVIENVRIVVTNQPAIVVQNFSNVIIRNVEITHEGNHGIHCSNAAGLTIENVSITHNGTSSPLPTHFQDNINCTRSDDLTIKNVRLVGGSSGIWIERSSNAHLSFIEGYNFRGPYPRGQLVQFDKSPFCTLEDFSVINDLDPTVSWTEDNVSIFQSENCTIRRGLIDGNNSPSGAAVMFEEGSNDGLVEDVDTIRQGNGSFSAFSVSIVTSNVTFRRTRARDNYCGDPGRGAPLSNALIWAGNPTSTGIRIEDSHYFNLCNPNNIVWDQSVFTLIEVSSQDFQLRAPILLQFPWETSSGGTTPDLINPDTTGTDTTQGSSTGGLFAQLYNTITGADNSSGDRDDVLVDFGSAGLWVLKNNSAWDQLTSDSPQSMNTGDLDGNGQDDVLVNFVGNGLWVSMNNSNWVQLHSDTPQSITVADIDSNGQDDVLVVLGVDGLWALMNNSTWNQLHTSSPESMLVANLNGFSHMDVLLDFGVNGLWVWVDNNNWSQLVEDDSIGMITGNFDGL